ncbi:hypothetical protein N7494_001688 [Penicillium frequentans]|uniref:DUF7730 domain-containing protein n=1 Tax=Penicillium frequentans TaxID=3151616 RepID=A0AAD6GJR5_9EURO|nr:hypothetical protein N7494_001688 [Penicillium glabrum]
MSEDWTETVIKGLAFSSDDKEPLEPPSSINPQIQSPLFRLPVEIRIAIYQLLFGNRVLHCERDCVDGKRKKWFFYSFIVKDWIGTTVQVGGKKGSGMRPMNLDVSSIRGYSTHAGEHRYTESLPILYGNEFRFSYARELCTTFPTQVSPSGFRHIRRVALWWTLGNDLQPHVSPENKANYDSLWRNLGNKYYGLTHIRIYIDSAYLAPMNSAGVAGDTESGRRQHMQNAWLEGIETMVKGNTDLEVFEIYFYTKVYQVLRNRVKPWLKEKEEERKPKNNAVRYKAYKCLSTTIKYAYCFSSPDGTSTDLSDGSSHIGIEDPKSTTFAWLRERRKLKQLQKIQQSQSDV